MSNSTLLDTTTRRRRPSLLPHPSEVNNSISPADYSFPSVWSNSFYEGEQEPFYRQQRSHNSQQSFFPPRTIMQENDIVARTRSKSTAAIMDIWSPHHNVQTDIEDAKWIFANNRTTTSARRSSLAPPTLISSISTSNTSPSFSNQRRHSLAGPTTTTTITTTILELESLSIREPTLDIKMKLDDMGKGKRLDSDNLKDAMFYVVEFKCGRSDLFYTDKLHKQNDLVLVEGDRGYDLGKIKMNDISKQQLEIYYNKLKKSNNSSMEGIIEEEEEQEEYQHQPNEIYIKCIFNIATTDEVTLFMTKGQDELKALIVCQSKIKQKKLNMQVIDAEYQWDRRKLTFYFIAEKRVDFRELVRELFKLYKTRIWMCAVASITQLVDPVEDLSTDNNEF